MVQIDAGDGRLTYECRLIFPKHNKKIVMAAIDELGIIIIQDISLYNEIERSKEQSGVITNNHIMMLLMDAVQAYLMTKHKKEIKMNAKKYGAGVEGYIPPLRVITTEIIHEY